MSEHSPAHDSSKRGNGAARPEHTLRFGNCELDFARHELRRDGALVALQPTPLRVLFYLAEQRGRTVSRHELFEAVWPGVIVGDDALTRALMEARRAVGDDSDAQRVIRTLKGLGYRFVAEVEVVGDGAGEASVASRPDRRRTWLAAAASAAVIAVVAASVGLRTPPTPESIPFGVAVLPIQSFSTNPEDRALADGLTEQITSTLAENGYPVVARTTAAQWRERAADVRDLAATLGVSHVLEGSVRRSAERVRLTLQLIACDTGKHVWSETFEDAGGDAFALQDEVTDRVAGKVRAFVWDDIVAIAADSELAKFRDQTVEFRAAYYESRLDDQLAAGEQLLSATPAREPFMRLRSDVNAGMSVAVANLYAYGLRSFGESAPQILALAEESVALAPDSAYAHMALSRALGHHWNWQRAEQEMRRTCEIAPRSIFCAAAQWHMCAALGCVSEQVDAARLWLRRERSDYGGWGALGMALVNDRQLEEAERALRRNRELGDSAELLANVLWRLGKFEEAVEALRQTHLAADAGDAIDGFDRARTRGPEAVWRWSAESWARDPQRLANSNQFFAARAYAEIGDFDAALVALEQSVAEHELGMEMFGLDPIFDSLRDTKRFRALTDAMGLTPYHEEYAVFERARQRVAAAAPHNEQAR